MLESNSKEAQSGISVMADAKKEVVQSFLEYLYSDKCTIKSELALDLLIMAVKYDVPGMAVITLNELGNYIHEENASDYLIMASKLASTPEVLEQIVQYVKSNLIEVKKTQRWEYLIEKSSDLVAMYLV